MYKCQECGRKFKTTRAAERASNHGCPGCGGVDIDLDVTPRKTDLGAPGSGLEQLGTVDPVAYRRLMGME